MFLLPVETLTERRPLSYGAPPERGMRLHTVPLRDCGFRTKRLPLWETPWNDEDNIGRFRVQQRQDFADTRRRIARIRFHRAQQRGQVIAYQHADRQRFARQGFGHAGEDETDKSFPDKRAVVSRRFARLRVCESLQERPEGIREADNGLRHEGEEDVVSLRVGR